MNITERQRLDLIDAIEATIVKTLAEHFILGDLKNRRMTMTTKTYDPACYALAKLFLDDHPELQHRIGDLAAHIQAEIENWLDRERDRMDPAMFTAMDEHREDKP